MAYTLTGFAIAIALGIVAWLLSTVLARKQDRPAAVFPPVPATETRGGQTMTVKAPGDGWGGMATGVVDVRSPGAVAARLAIEAEALDKARRRHAETWIALPRPVPLRLAGVTDWGVWYARPLADGRETHGLATWETVRRDLGMPA
jgi:hypothetical protein